MKISIKIARRYLFARRSANAINVITGISVAGIAIGTAALVLVLSVFNGFEDLIVGLFSKFNPDIKVEAAVGKTFESDVSKIAAIRALPQVAFLSETLEEVAFFEYGDHQDFGIMKGVDSLYHRVNGIDTTLYEGSYRLQESDRSLAVLGGGMRNKLQADVENPFELLNIFMARREKVGVLEQQYKKRFVFPVGTFRIQQDYDNQYVLVSLDFARDMLGVAGEVSAYEIRLREGSDKEAVIERIQALMGEGFEVKDRYRQDEAFLKLMNLEKWMSFAILSLTLVLVAFNMIGSLWMMVLDKKGDIAILKSMGAQDVTIRNIFLYLGLLLCLLGLAAGFLLATALYVLQKNYGMVAIPEGFVVSAYPISLRVLDLVAVMLVVLLIGLMASLPAAMRARQVSALINRE